MAMFSRERMRDAMTVAAGDAPDAHCGFALLGAGPPWLERVVSPLELADGAAADPGDPFAAGAASPTGLPNDGIVSLGRLGLMGAPMVRLLFEGARPPRWQGAIAGRRSRRPIGRRAAASTRGGGETACGAAKPEAPGRARLRAA
jgi:hypothetical protein